MKTLTKQEVFDMIYGCTILGTGGGGSLLRGLEMLEKDFAEGKELNMISLDELPDDGMIATPYGCGAPIKEGEGLDPKFDRLPRLDDSPAVLAFRTLEEYLGEKCCAVSSTELGGENTAEALHIACQLGLPIVDSDPTGRSVPDLQHTTYYVHDLPIYPLALATNFGETMIIKNVIDDFRAEDIVRAVVVASGNELGGVDHPMRGEVYKKSVIPDALTYAMNIGKTLRETKSAGGDVAAALADSFDGKILFKGTIGETPWESRDGFNFGNIHINGIGSFQGETYRIWIKNENIVSYRNEAVDVSVPDLICMVDKNGEPVTNPNWVKDMEVTVFALPAPEIWKTPKGLEVFGPRSFNFDFDYKPFK